MATPMESFFRTFERLSAESNAADLAGLYAPSFLLAGPSGSQCTATRLATLEETVLDDRYSLVRAEWHWRFERSCEALVEFTLPSSYVVERSPDRWQIVAYIPHADIMAELRRRGLFAAGA